MIKQEIRKNEGWEEKTTVSANIPISKSSYILDKLNSLVLLRHQVWGLGGKKRKVKQDT